MRSLLEAEYLAIADVTSGLIAVENHCLPLRDRRGIFVTAYLQITRAIQAALERKEFHDPEWVTRYLVASANLYRSALFNWEARDPGGFRNAGESRSARPRREPDA